MSSELLYLQGVRSAAPASALSDGPAPRPAAVCDEQLPCCWAPAHDPSALLWAAAAPCAAFGWLWSPDRVFESTSNRHRKFLSLDAKNTKKSLEYHNSILSVITANKWILMCITSHGWQFACTIKVFLTWDPCIAGRDDCWLMLFAVHLALLPSSVFLTVEN